MSKNKQSKTLSFARKASERNGPDKATIALTREAAAFGIKACRKTMENETQMGFKSLAQIATGNAPVTAYHVEVIIPAAAKIGFQPSI